MAIDLQHFLDGYKTHEVVFGDKKWIFREPSIKTLLTIKDQQGAEQLVKEILLQGTYEDLDEVLNQMTVEKKEAFFEALLKELGLK